MSAVTIYYCDIPSIPSQSGRIVRPTRNVKIWMVCHSLTFHLAVKVAKAVTLGPSIFCPILTKPLLCKTLIPGLLIQKSIRYSKEKPKNEWDLAPEPLPHADVCDACVLGYPLWVVKVSTTFQKEYSNICTNEKSFGLRGIHMKKDLF